MGGLVVQWVPRIFYVVVFFFQAEDGIRDLTVTGVQTCALPISATSRPSESTSNAASAFASGTGPRSEASEIVVAKVISPERSITAASAVRPSRDRKSVV